MQRKMAFFTLLFLLACVTMNAQFKKGEQMISASIGSVFFNSGTSDVSSPTITQGYTSKTTSFGVNFSPFVGWFVSDHTATGISLNINPSNNKISYESNGATFQQDKANSFNVGLGGFVRNYFKTSSSFIPFAQFGLNFGISTQSTSGFFYGGSGSNVYKTSYTGKSSGGSYINASLLFGITKLLSPHTGLDIYTGYSFSYTKNTVKTTTLRDDGNNGSIDQSSESNLTSKSSNNGFQLGVGFQVFLDRRK